MFPQQVKRKICEVELRSEAIAAHMMACEVLSKVERLWSWGYKKAMRCVAIILGIF